MAASYPGSVKTFATRSNGQTIDASHVNDLQDEVNAIEAGILNGTAPLTSSNTAVNHLQVNGNSTIAGSVTVSSVVTINGQPQCFAYRGSTEAVPHNTWTTLSFDSELFDIGAMHSTGTNPSRLIAGSSGLFAIVSQVTFSGNSSGYRGIRVVVNGSTSSTGIIAGVTQVANGANQQFMQVHAMYRLPATSDYIEVQAFQNTGASLESSPGNDLYQRNQLVMTKLA